MNAEPPQYNENAGAGAARPFHPPSMVERNSVASSTAPFSAIGALLSQPYDSDDEDGRSIRHPQAYHGGDQPRAGDARTQASRNGYGVSEKVQSYEGDVGQGRPKSIVHFPGPNIGHSHHPGQGSFHPSHGPGGYPQPQHSSARPHPQHNHSGHARAPPPPSPQPHQPPCFPQQTYAGPRSPHPDRPQPTIHIPSPRSMSPHPLPKPQTPISPALAAAPFSATSYDSALTPPRSAFSSAPGSRSSVASSSASITAYDSMEKTHSLMRGGEDELMAPVNTRRPQRKRSTSAANALGGMRKTVFGQPGGEFWKRFSVMARLDDNKESDWLVAEQARKRRIRNTAIIGVAIIAIIIGAVVIAVVVTNTDNEDARPKTLNRASD